MRLGLVGFGTARSGEVRQGSQGSVRYGRVRLGRVWQGQARHGMAGSTTLILNERNDSYEEEKINQNHKDL